MHRRKLGRTDIQLGELGIGTWEISGDVWGKKDDAESIRAMKAGLDAGANFIDTAAGYGGGHAESLVGSLFGQHGVPRDQVVLSTKVLPECGVFAPPPHRTIDAFYSGAWIRTKLEESLRRLDTDYVDLLFLHTWSRAWGHEEEWYDAMARMRSEGKIRAIGISIPDEGITDANVHIEAGRVDVVQCVYNILQQEPEHSLFPLAQKCGVGIIARSPLSSGALTGSWTADMSFEDGDWRATWPLDIKENWLGEQVRMATAVADACRPYGVAMAEAALRYTVAHPAVTSVIPGSANPEHVRANMAAADADALPPDLIAELQRLWQEGSIVGTYNGSV